ncbi:MAG: TIGR00730 family Rossman fold protein [Pirellulales bacterium]|nr:TIGR00730 family Rossman fold protein [Pirellulales bacterium]
MELQHNAAQNRREILESHSYRLAEQDIDFLGRHEQRPVRMQLELQKVETLLHENHINSTVVVFGGTQVLPHEQAEARLAGAKRILAKTPNEPRAIRAVKRAESVLEKSHFYDDAREFGRLVSTTCQINNHCDFVIATGGGPGIMEAANRGAFDAGCKSIGFNIELPHEQEPNAYITPELCFQFSYFALRKFHFVLRARALVVFPGGFGTLDELFNTLTLRQTGRMQEIPIILYGEEYWRRLINFQAIADEGVIADEHLDLIHFAETPDEAWTIIAEFHQLN